MSRFRSAVRQRRFLVDSVFAAAVAGACAPLSAATGTHGPDWFWFALLYAPLAWRRRAPVVVFWIVVVVAVANAGVGAAGPALLIVPMVAGYSAARYRHRRYLWPAAVPLVLFVAGWVGAGGQWWDAVALSALFVAAVLLGTNVQTRQAYLAELEDRARRLERERDQQARLAVAAERARIAREMHDIVAHNLAVMVALADGAVATTPVAPERAMDMMGKAAMTGRDALREVRRLVGLLHEGGDGRAGRDAGGAHFPQPGFDAIDALIGQVRAAGLRVTLTREGVPGDWGAGAGLAVYRIVQEALTNTMRHAGAQSRAQVRLCYRDGGAEVVITDDGGGYRAAAPAGGDPAGGHRVVALPGGRPTGGHGLAGMSERAAAYGGTVDAGPRAGRGWQVHARLTFDPGEAA